MLATTCGACGSVAKIDESRVPPSGLVTRCPRCGGAITFTPPGMGLLSEEPETAGAAEDDIIDLPAPKTKSQPAPDLPDLLAPVGPRPRARSRSEIPDLLAPVGPTSRKGVTDLLAPVGPTSRNAPDLLAPVGPTSTRNAPDLLAPVGPTSTRNAPDLLAPVGPTSTRNAPDLLAPVGPTSRNAPDLLTPVGPTSVRNAPDLLTPVGPVPVRNVPDLPTPVGPTSTRNAPDLLTPVGPVPVRNAPDLPTPVGPTSTRNAPDLLTPVGPEPIRNAPGLPTPVGPVPTKGVDLPAPKGFFDEAPPPTPASASRQGSAAATLDLEDLDVVPAGGTRSQGGMDLGESSLSAPPASTTPPFAMDGLDLSPPPPPNDAPAFDTGMSYGEVDLPSPPSDAGLVSFSRPTGAARAAEAAAASGSSRSIDLGAAPARRKGTLATDSGESRAAGRAPSAVAVKKRRRNRIVTVVGILLLAGAAAYYVYTSVELTIGTFLTEPARERRDHIAAGLVTTRKLLRADEPGHWNKAIAAGRKVVPLYKEKPFEPQGLIAQAYLGAVFDEGLRIKEDREAADAIISDMLKAGSKDVEVDKAVALRSALDPGKAGDALGQLEQIGRRAPRDPDVALYTGWAALEAGQAGKAQQAFTKALQLSPNRQAALLGLGRALMALGENAKAKETFQKIFDRANGAKNYGAWLAITELSIPARDPEGRREKELGVLCERAPERETAHPRDRARAYTLYGDEALARGRWEQAVERYRAARELDNRNVDAMVGRAMATIELRSSATGQATSLAEARRDLEQVLYLEPRHVGALVGMTRINLLEGRPSEASKNIEAALALDEKNALVHYWRGKVLEDPTMNKPGEAEKAYQRSIELAPSDYAAYVALSQLYLARAVELERVNKKADAAAVRARAVTILQPVADAARSDAPMANVLGAVYRAAHDNVSAEKWFRAALTVDAGLTDARLNLAATLEAGGRMDEAVKEYRAAVAAAPKREDAALGLAGILERTRDIEGAEKIYQALLSTAGGNVPSTRAHAAAGRYFARRGRIEQARAQGDILASLDPQNPAAAYLQAVGLIADGKLPDALKLLRTAVALDPEAQYYDAIGWVGEQQKALGDAQTAYEQAIRLDAGYAPPYLGLGRIHIARREFVKALDVLDRAAKIDPDKAEIWSGMGDAHRELLHFAEAEAAYQQALARDGGNATTHYKLGRVYFDDDKAAEAVTHLRQAINDAPSGVDWLAEAHWYLARRLQANGDRNGMCVEFKAYLDLAPPTAMWYKQAKQERASCPL